MLKNISVVTITLFFLLLYSWQATAAKKMIEDINFEHSDSGEERITFKLNGTYIPKIFTLQGKQPRVVFDFKDTTAAKMINNIINTNGELIKRIRVGIHKGDDPKTRVVLDLRPNKNVNIHQDFDKKEQSLVISIHYAGGRKPVQKKKKNKAKAVTVTPRVTTQPVQPQEKQVSVVAQIAKKPLEKLPVPKIITRPVPAPVKKRAEIPLLTSISFDDSSNRGEMVLFKLNEFHPPIVFGIEEGTPRVVCDFKNTVAAKNVPERLTTGGKYIQKIRIGKQSKENKVRVVLDLVPNYSYDLQQVFFKEENLFMIIINTLGSAPIDDPSELLK
ncbi:MAG: AMIN domain-containing protein [Candidatus Electrothrix sp. AS4_5]|nr:AMIN domain-containing protein [Candidatus Electrothrix gigas]